MVESIEAYIARRPLLSSLDFKSFTSLSVLLRLSRAQPPLSHPGKPPNQEEKIPRPAHGHDLLRQ